LTHKLRICIIAINKSNVLMETEVTETVLQRVIVCWKMINKTFT